MDLKVNPDLAMEREKATFNIEELTNILDGGVDNTNERRRYENALLKYSCFSDFKDLLSISPDDQYEKGLEFMVEQRKCYIDDPVIREMMEHYTLNSYPQLQSIAVPHFNILGLHSVMFTATIESQGTEEQKKKWLPLAQQFKIIGTYCQTELGHGTNMRGLETTATYDPNTEEFILHSPTLTSTKFWPGGLAFSCNFAIVICQLYTQGKCRGIHLFLVQIRDLKDHSPLPGIKAGSIGPKMGMHAMDNGFVHFHNVRIPRENMLMRYAQVLKDGTYVNPPRKRTGYGVFFASRLFIARNMASNIAKGTTIAIRYGAIRHQGQVIPEEEEVKILDYPTYQNKIFPHIATAYAILIASRSSLELFINAIGNPTEENISELHAISSGLKSFSSKAAVSALEQCRLACGGLGYLQASNLPVLLSSAVAACTYEGDNTVMQLQTARYLVKIYQMAKQGAPVPSSVAFLAHHIEKPTKAVLLKNLLLIFQTVTFRSVAEVSEQMEVCLSEGQKPELVWQNNTNHLLKCAQLYCQSYLLDCYEKFCLETVLSNSLQTVLDNLYELLAISWIQQSAAVIVSFSDVDGEFLKNLASRRENLLQLLRPNAVALVDAFDFRDQALRSILGCYDGNVYERVFDYVKNLPMTGKVHPAFKKFLQPHLASKI